jgi:SnoaL-like domain
MPKPFTGAIQALKPPRIWRMSVLMEGAMRKVLALSAIFAFCLAGVAIAGSQENAQEFVQFHKVEIDFHEAGSTKNLDLMLSLFADDAVLTTKRKTDDGKEQIKTYTGKEQIKKYWQAHPAFQPQNQWVGYTPAFRIRYTVEGDRAHLYFECLWMDKTANKIAAHTNSDDTLVRVNGAWLIKEMTAAAVPEL